MKLVYCDESGDPGYPRFQTPIYVLSFLYLDTKIWKECFQEILNKRREIRENYQLPIRMEFHTREFILNKNPYVNLKINVNRRIEIVNELINLLLSLSEKGVQVISMAIIKNRINTIPYSILDKAFTYGLQRIDNNIYKNKNLYENFMLIIDNGYLEKVRKISRKMYRYNYVPYNDSDYSRSIKLDSLIDDPFSKDSKESYFIQLADLMAYIVSQYIDVRLGLNMSPKRRRIIKDEIILEWMKRLEPLFNVHACPHSEFGYGIFTHPKN